MALPDVHVICGYAGGDGTSPAKQALFRDPQWSAEPASNTPTTQSAPDEKGLVPVFRVTPNIDIYVSIAPSPNPDASPRHLLLASDGTQDLYARGGDKFAWKAV